MYWHHPYFLFLYPFWPFYLFTKEKTILGALLLPVQYNMHCQNSLLADGDYKLWDFYFGTENKSDWKSWNIFFKKRTIIFSQFYKKKTKPILYPPIFGTKSFLPKRNNRTHFLIQNIT